MNSEEIKQLLEKYYDGESTVKEEAYLKSFFSHGDIPEDLLDEKQIFNYYLKSSVVPEPSLVFEKNIFDALDSVEKDSLNLKRRSVFVTMTAIAAGLLILTGSYFFFIHKSEPGDTFSDPEIAYAETLKILYSVSSQLNTGTKALDRLGSMQEVTRQSLVTINRSASTIQEKMKPLDNLRKAGNIIDNTDDKN